LFCWLSLWYFLGRGRRRRRHLFLLLINENLWKTSILSMNIPLSKKKCILRWTCNIWEIKLRKVRKLIIAICCTQWHGITVEKHSYNSDTFEAVRKGKVYKILVQAMGIFGFSFLGYRILRDDHGNI
jgi:hypothetical protein